MEFKRFYLIILAPGAYSPEKTNFEHQPAFTFGGRYDTEKPSKTPGTYFFTTTKLYDLQFCKFNSSNLAPGSYSPEKCKLEYQPAFSFGIKPEQKIESVAPAPNQYEPEKCKLEYQPAFSFGGRHNLEKPNQTPGILIFIALFIELLLII